VERRTWPLPGRTTVFSDVSDLAYPRSLAFCLDANDSGERLNALGSDRRIYLGLDGLGSLVAKLFRGKGLNLLRGGLGRTSKNNPLQRNEKNPFHEISPALHHPITACRPSITGRGDPARSAGICYQPRDQVDGSLMPSRQISIANSVLALAANNMPPGLSFSSPANPSGAA
jgi:hypothetical protein